MRTQPPQGLLLTLKIFDSISIVSGKLTAWLIFPMVGSLVYEVIARYFFDSPTIWAYDTTYMFYGAFFMLGAAYTLYRKGHIRTDFFYNNWSVRCQGWVDAAAYLLFFFPSLIVFLAVSWDFFYQSWSLKERIVTSPWMPIVYPFKLVLTVATALLLIQGISELIKSLYAALKGEWL